MFSFLTKIWNCIGSWFRFSEPKQHYIEKKKSDWKNPEAGSLNVTVSFVVEMPDNVKPNTVYIVGENDYYWMAGILCPCGCGNFIYLNLLNEANPRWKYKIAKGLISISPSVWRTNGCKSHFFIRRGEVIWAVDY